MLELTGYSLWAKIIKGWGFFVFVFSFVLLFFGGGGTLLIFCGNGSKNTERGDVRVGEEKLKVN